MCIRDSNTLVMELIAIVAIIFAGTFIAIHLVAPFHAMAKSIEEIQTGYGDDALKIDAYTCLLYTSMREMSWCVF